ncbi:flagellar motor protein [Candidatus Photodesmus katoptron]|nr:flagellar motor protein [Candidatus Photodesmus katoptron]
MATFADLMSLLMCFFVLLLSFSEMDVLKFKQISGSMKFAFGIQKGTDLELLPKGSSIIAQDFLPSQMNPTPIETIMQEAINISNKEIDSKNDGIKSKLSIDKYRQSEIFSKKIEKSLKMALRMELSKSIIEIENLGQQIVIRIQEKGVFPEESAFLQPQFKPLIRRIANLVKDIPGIVRISGHTDNQPLDSELYRSNWDLSSQRAVSVAHDMEKVPGFSHQRIRVVGMADTNPLGPNDTEWQRARNRRVEIAILQGEPTYSEEISLFP